MQIERVPMQCGKVTEPGLESDPVCVGGGGREGKEVTPQAEKRWCCGTGESGGVQRETRQLAIEEASEGVFIVILS